MIALSEDNVMLCPSQQHTNLWLLGALLHELQTAFTTRYAYQRPSRSEQRLFLQRCTAEKFRLETWRHLKKTHHGEIEQMIAQGLRQGDIARHLNELHQTCQRLGILDLPCYANALLELRHQGFTLATHECPHHPRLLVSSPLTARHFDETGKMVTPLDLLAGYDDDALKTVRNTFTDNGFQVIQRTGDTDRLSRLHIGSDNLNEDCWAYRFCRTQYRLTDEEAVKLS